MAKYKMVKGYKIFKGDSVNGPIDKLIDILIKSRDMYENPSLCIEFNYSGDVDIIISYLRQETDDERETRLKLAKRKRDKRAKEKLEKELLERKQYEKLKKKYGGDNV